MMRTTRTRTILLTFTTLLTVLVVPLSTVARQSNPLDASTLTVNVEFILDASGSMAELVPGADNQTRMDAAKEAMREVIDQLPDRDGLNVGFRVYGHKGSNAESDREVSCTASDLMVPMDGVDRDGLLTQIDAAAPTGWTPLAYSLTEAAKDFTPGGESITNAVIMVTDGEDTCGGDPCTVAKDLHDSGVSLTTHVVGLALSPEQQDAVSCIAANGGGELFAATDASSLSEAVLSAFAQVDATPVPVETKAEVVVGGYIAGNAFAFLPEGEEGALSVVAVGQFDGRHLPVVVHNRTGSDVMEITVAAVARADGAMVAVGADQGFAPQVVKDGTYAIADVFFGDELPEGVTYDFQVGASAVDPDDVVHDLTINEVNGTDAAVLGLATNDHDVAVGVPSIDGSIACFDGDGNLLDFGRQGVGGGPLASGGFIPFEFPVPSVISDLQTDTCPVFLVAVNAWATE